MASLPAVTGSSNGLASLNRIHQFPEWSVHPLIELLTHENRHVRATAENVLAKHFSGRLDISLDVLDASLETNRFSNELVTVCLCLGGKNSELAQLAKSVHSTTPAEEIVKMNEVKNILREIAPRQVSLRARLGFPLES